jgi:dihydrolipoamide dehydrogenase
MDVTLVDLEANPGGVCLYRGCIPSKALLHVTKLIDETEHATDWGVSFGKPAIDLDRLRGFKDDVVSKLTGGLGQLAKRRKVRFLRARARFVSATGLALEPVGDAEAPSELKFGQAILATGSSPARIPGFPDSDLVLDSTSALDLADVPKHLLVVGGGYIGLELGTVYAALGSKVTVVEMLDGLLPGADDDLVRPLARRLESRFESIRLGTKVASVKVAGKKVKVEFDGGEGPATGTYDRVLVSIGRKPNSADLGLESTRVEVGDGGFVRVGDDLRTAEPNIFAIGDLVGQPMLAHKASHEGVVAAENAAGGKTVFDPSAIPAVVFTDPEIAWAGLTEHEAKERGREIEVARFPWAASGRAKTLGREDGLTKLILDPKTERVLGVGLCGPGAGELIAEGVLAIEMGAVAEDLAKTIHPHPTLSETVMESAEVFFGHATHTFKPKRTAKRG